METRGNFILIGLFTIVGAIGIVGLLLWFARVELDQQFDYYDINFSSVSGLSDASDVRFAGLPVGQVVDVRLSPDRDGTVSVRIEVDAATPVRVDSVATIESQGVTGVSFVGIGPGTPEAEMLLPTLDEPVPNITAGRSVFQTLSEEAPRLLSETIAAVEEVNNILGGDNAQRVENILINTETASEIFVDALGDFSAAASSAAEFGAQVALFNSILDSVAGDLQTLLVTADDTLTSFGALSDEAEAVLEAGADTLLMSQGTISAVETYITQDLTAATTETRASLSALQAEIAAISTEARSMLAIFAETGTTANARLEESAATIAAADVAIADFIAAMTSLDETTLYFDTLMREEAEPFLAEARVAFAQATTIIAAVAETAETDLPVIVSDIRAATAAARETITAVGADLTDVSGQIDGLAASAQTTLAQVTDTFANANTTLTAVNEALAVGERTLEAATRTFEGADRIINEDIDDIVAGLQVSLDSLNAAIGEVSADLPEITEGLRGASQSAADAFAEVQSVIEASGGSITSFATQGLPSITSLVSETRQLIRNLDRLTTTISRDPARFLLDQQVPEFRR